MSLTEAPATSEANRVARFLGLRNWSAIDDLALVERVEAGLPTTALEQIIRQIDPNGTFLGIDDIVPKATFYRRKEQRKPLSKTESDTIVALARVLVEALRQYRGDTVRAVSFLRIAHPMLGGRTPLDMAKTSAAGAEVVLKLLARAEAGVAA
jgi:putative toxin-antitoxin system antitoxin component (TIGR02293 family)